MLRWTNVDRNLRPISDIRRGSKKYDIRIPHNVEHFTYSSNVITCGVRNISEKQILNAYSDCSAAAMQRSLPN